MQVGDINQLIEKSEVFFTSDTHFCHKNIIKYCNRPFETVEQMNQTLVDNWNSVVPKDGLVFHLGDFCFGGSKEWKHIRNSLNGEIVLILGNHDHASKTMLDTLFYDVYKQLTIKIDGYTFILNHYPFLSYAGAYHKPPVMNLFGHIHSGPLSCSGKDMSRLSLLLPTQYDVGVDNNDFKPISYEDLIQKFKDDIRNT